MRWEMRSWASWTCGAVAGLVLLGLSGSAHALQYTYADGTHHAESGRLSATTAEILGADFGDRSDGIRGFSMTALDAAGLDSLTLSDDDRFQVDAAPFFLAADRRAAMLFEFQVVEAKSQVASVAVSVEAAQDSFTNRFFGPGHELYAYLWNADAGAYTLGGSRLGWNDDGSIDFVFDTGAGAYLDGDAGQVTLLLVNRYQGFFGLESGFDVDFVSLDVQVVPEPTSLLLAGLGLLGLAAFGRRGRPARS
ncbi:MAG: PEP-CTERM sorting domain-containing protein [Proteobacteria bacterium]|nr:PEP-CTERM sorting domain-containing protein [Pseudomonadota bacterium]